MTHRSQELSVNEVVLELSRKLREQCVDQGDYPMAILSEYSGIPVPRYLSRPAMEAHAVLSGKLVERAGFLIEIIGSLSPDRAEAVINVLSALPVDKLKSVVASMDKICSRKVRRYSVLTVSPPKKIQIDDSPLPEGLRTELSDGRPMNLNIFRSRPKRLCAQTLMTIFDQHFVSARPVWLKNPLTGCVLQLDCYNEDLALAVQYNGAQHYEGGHYGMTPADLEKQRGRDKSKVEICERRGVHLIVVPHTVDTSKVPEYIAERIPERLRSSMVHSLDG